jgi:hypothetical protein
MKNLRDLTVATRAILEEPLNPCCPYPSLRTQNQSYFYGIEVNSHKMGESENISLSLSHTHTHTQQEPGSKI